MRTRDIISRIGYVRNKANLSARELSQRIGKSPQYISQLENGRITLSVEKLISILEVCDYPIEKFFYDNPEDYDIDKELISMIKNLPSAKKSNLIELLKK